jgi:type VI secretion system protein ImpL
MRALLTLLGLLAAAGLVWQLGPLLAVGPVAPLASTGARAVAIAGLFGLGLIVVAWRAARRAGANRGLIDELAGRGAAAGAGDVAAIGKRFEEALRLLKRSRLGRPRSRFAALAGRPYVYELPWYVIIGAPGSGKTTALINSGLEFPLADKLGDKVIRGVGGTRHCDWWFTSDAVLIDTAGRFTTQDSDKAADRAAWGSFLKLLARHRPRRPIDGVLLTVSVSDLLDADPARRLVHARELRARLDELHEQLGVRMPVYLLITKTDLLAGFMEFFADFGKDERAQVWGVTFPLEAGNGADPLVRLNPELAALEKRLNECLLDRLRGEPDREKRAAIYAFPQQWRVLRETLLEFLQAAVGEAGAHGARPLVRGVYFTSATQDGMPMDRVLGALARRLGLANRVVPPLRPSGKAFFVTHLLRELIFSEAGLAGTNRAWERRRAVLQWSVVGVTSVAVLGALGLAWAAYRDNQGYLAAAQPSLQGLEQKAQTARAAAPTDLPAIVPLLDGLQAAADAAAPPPSMLPSAGLDRRGMLHAAAADSYREALREAFLPRIAARLEQRLRTEGQEHVQTLYEALKAYLMLFGGRNFDRVALRSYLHADWETTLPPQVDAATRDALLHHLDRLLAGGEVGAPSNADAGLIARARAQVAQVPLAQRVYSRLRQQDLGPGFPPFTFAAAGGPMAGKVFVRASGQPLTRGVPPLYTAAVQRGLRSRGEDVLRQLAREDAWVLGLTSATPAQPAVVLDEVERMAQADRVKLWDAYLRDLRLVPSTDLGASIELAQALARTDSPLAALLSGLAREFGAVPGTGSAPAAPDDAPQDSPVERLAALQRYLVEQSALGDLLALIGKLATQLQATDDALKRKAPPPGHDALRELSTQAVRAPEPVRTLLGQLADTGTRQLFVVLREPLERQLAGEIGPACLRAVQGRYPFLRSASEEIGPEEFAAIFGTGGLLDGFFQRQLGPFVDTSTRPWALRAGGAAEKSDSLPQFQRAQAIRETLLRDGGRRPSVQLELKLVSLDAGIGQLVFDLGGQSLRFSAASRQPVVLRWPGPSGSGRVVLQAGASGGAGYAFEGPWGLFRLLDRVRIEPRAGGRALLTIDVEGRRARFEARSLSPINPLVPGELEQFQCPRRL